MKILSLSQTKEVLLRGEIVAYPTETVWGLGALHSQEKAIENLIDLKGREQGKAISLLVSDMRMAKEYAVIESQRLITWLQSVWPGPVTVVLKAQPKVSPLVHGGTGEVGLRISNHPLVQKLMLTLAEPLTTTSANRSGKLPARQREELEDWLPAQVGVLEGSEALGFPPSTVVRALSDHSLQILREGSVTREQLKKTARTCSLSLKNS